MLGLCIGDVRALNANGIAGEQGELGSHAPILACDAQLLSRASGAHKSPIKNTYLMRPWLELGADRYSCGSVEEVSCE